MTSKTFVEKNIDQYAPTTVTNAKCPYFGICGGCTMQHISSHEQIIIKQQWLLDCLKNIAKSEPDNILDPINGKQWKYRYKARLSVRFVNKKYRVLVGFNEVKKSFVTDMEQCCILPKDISELISPLKKLIHHFTIFDKIPQIDIAKTEKMIALTIRHLSPFSNKDLALLLDFQKQYSLQIYLQSAGINSLQPFQTTVPELEYCLNEFNLNFKFLPYHFTQINPEINNKMIHQAIALLKPNYEENIADMFCGIGNFTLPLSKYSSIVTGFEINKEQVEYAKKNAALNNLTATTTFTVKDLSDFNKNHVPFQNFDKMIIDPPRSGASALMQSLDQFNPKLLLYISCNLESLAHDAQILIHQKGYRLNACGIINMFPHTLHTESIALFEKK